MAIKTSTRFLLLMFVMALATAQAGAQTVKNNNLALRYEVFWGGLHAADFLLSAHSSNGQYEHSFRLRTQGMFDMFLSLDVSARGTGLLPDLQTLKPKTYDVDFTNRWRRGDIAMRFDPGSGDVESTYRSYPPRDDQDDKERVSADERRGALDPLAAFLEVVRRAGAAGEEKTFLQKVFDGRRRYDAKGEVLGIVHKNLLDKAQDALHVRLTTLPVAGFNQRQLDIWDGKTFDIYLSTDGRLVPIKISGEGTGPQINLIEECTTVLACQLPGDDRPEQAFETRTVLPPG